MKWRRKIERAQRLHRPSLRNWERDGLAKVFSAWRDTLPQQQNQDKNQDKNQNQNQQQNQQQDRHRYYEALLLPGVSHPASLPVVLDATTLDSDLFATTLEAKGIPCVIRNVPQVEGWEAPNCWDLESLESSDEMRNRYFKCGEDDDGKTIKVKMKHFLKYLHSNQDDSPLYIFDSTFEDDRKAKKILSDYQVPKYFRNDLFGLISEERRPPYRWFLVGPERSGTTVHIDPLATAAWNTLIVGQKRWVLFPPHVPKHIAKGKHFVMRGEDDEAVHYFMTILPRIKQKAKEIGNRGVFKDFACYEFTQQAGETVFIPNGWWHGVINLTHTVGITQNFCSPRNFEQVWCKARDGRKLMAAKWINQLDVHHPHLADQARGFNQRDRFVMKHNPDLVKRRDAAKARFRESGKQQKEQQQKMNQQKQQLKTSSNKSNRPQQRGSGNTYPTSLHNSNSSSSASLMASFNSSFENTSFRNAVGSLKEVANSGSTTNNNNSARRRSSSTSNKQGHYPNVFTKVSKTPLCATTTTNDEQHHQTVVVGYDITDAITNANQQHQQQWHEQKQDNSFQARDVKRTRRVSPT